MSFYLDKFAELKLNMIITQFLFKNFSLLIFNMILDISVTNYESREISDTLTL